MRLLKLLIALTLCLSLSVTVFAHPGKTDSSGGHTDHSTGDYHYHHGYSAHQHYDSDGDGVLDCPYDFKDMTGINSCESPKKETHSAMISPYKKNPVVEETQKVTIPELENEKVTDGKSKEGKTFGDYVLDAFCFLMEIYIVVGSVWGLIRLIKLIFGKQP